MPAAVLPMQAVVLPMPAAARPTQVRRTADAATACLPMTAEPLMPAQVAETSTPGPAMGAAAAITRRPSLPSMAAPTQGQPPAGCCSSAPPRCSGDEELAARPDARHTVERGPARSAAVCYGVGALFRLPSGKPLGRLACWTCQR